MADLEARLERWLAEREVEGTRRIVRMTDDQILVSKFEPGFAAGLHDLLARVPELFEEAGVVERYRQTAAALPADTPRIDAWHAAMHATLREATPRLGVDDDRIAEIRAGIDSVRAVLEAVLWSGPTLSDGYTPRPGEREGYLDGLAALQDERDIFTRYYGDLDGRAVVNHCPGASYARRMLAHAWTACTGEAPPPH